MSTTSYRVSKLRLTKELPDGVSTFRFPGLMTDVGGGFDDGLLLEVGVVGLPLEVSVNVGEFDDRLLLGREDM